MSKKIMAVLLGLVAVICMVASLLLFLTVYQPEIDIADTKLQYYVVSSYEDGVIYCQENTKLNLDRCAKAIFDEQAFLKSVDAGDQIFARVNSADLKENREAIRTYGVMSTTEEYLGLDELNERYSEATVTAALILVFGILLAISFGSLSVYLFCSKKK